MRVAIPSNKNRNKLVSKPALLLYVLLISLVSFVLYSKSVHNDFLDLDDTSIVVKNYPFLEKFSNIQQAFKQGVFQQQGIKDTLASYYRPVMTLSLMLDAHISPSSTHIPSPKPFLISNIIYHTLACILLLLVLLELDILPLPSLFLTLIFTVHPLLNQAIAWIPGRNDTLLAICILASFLFLLKYLKYNRTYSTFYLLHILFFLFALFTKENAIVFIPLSFLFLRFVNKKPVLAKTYISLAIAYAVCVIPWFLLRQNALSTNGPAAQILGSFRTFVGNIPYFIQYVGKAILPVGLSVMSTPADTNYVLGIAGIAIILIGVILSKTKKLELVLFGLLWFLFFLTPSLLSSFSGLEHRTYLPLMGAIFIASQFDWIKKASLKSPSIGGKAGLGILIVVFAVFFFISRSRLNVFENRFVFDKNAMETSPKSVLPCLYLAKHYEEVKDYDSAIITYREALKRDSNAPLVYTNIAGDYICMNNYTDAEKELRRDVKLHPDNHITLFDLGLVIFQSSLTLPPGLANQRDSEAVALWKMSIKFDSGFAKPYNVLRQYYQATGDSANTVLYRKLYQIKNKY